MVNNKTKRTTNAPIYRTIRSEMSFLNIRLHVVGSRGDLESGKVSKKLKQEDGSAGRKWTAGPDMKATQARGPFLS
jgi:hypothetical protein